jgi:hypothetical protein
MSDINEAAGIWLAYNEAAAADDFERMAQLVAPGLAVTDNGVPALGSAADDEVAMRQLRHDYPDYRREVVEVIPAGERATVRWRMTGSPRDPSAAPMDISGCSIVRVEGGVITEAHLYSPAPLA